MRLFLSAAALAALIAVSGPVSAQQPQPASPQQSPQQDIDRPADMDVFVNGRLNVPGAPADSETVPAKFSERNAWVDSLPTMAASLIWLDDAQKNEIAQSVRAANVPAVQSGAKPAEEIAENVALHDLPAPLLNAIPGLDGYQYARTDDRVLIVREPGGVVVGAIPFASTTGEAAK
jgi:hypothetical protein